MCVGVTFFLCGVRKFICLLVSVLGCMRAYVHVRAVCVCVCVCVCVSGSEIIFHFPFNIGGILVVIFATAVGTFQFLRDI